MDTIKALEKEREATKKEAQVTNGHVNGKASGYTNGHTNGYVNGHANGHAKKEL